MKITPHCAAPGCHTPLANILYLILIIYIRLITIITQKPTQKQRKHIMEKNKKNEKENSNITILYTENDFRWRWRWQWRRWMRRHWLYPRTLITVEMSNTITSQPFIRSFVCSFAQKKISPHKILNNQVITLIILGNFYCARDSKLWIKQRPCWPLFNTHKSQNTISRISSSPPLPICYRIPNEWFYCIRSMFLCAVWIQQQTTTATQKRYDRRNTTRYMMYSIYVVICVSFGRARKRKRSTKWRYPSYSENKSKSHSTKH